MPPGRPIIRRQFGNLRTTFETALFCKNFFRQTARELITGTVPGL